MLRTNVTAIEKPDVVTLEALPEGETRIILAKNIRKVTTEDEQGATEISYKYDEVVFLYPEGEKPTKTAIKNNLDAWWEYGSQPEVQAPTREERIGVAEDTIAALVDMIMGGE